VVSNFEEVLENISSGLLLCELANILTHKKVLGIYHKPISEFHCKSNIGKAL